MKRVLFFLSCLSLLHSLQAYSKTKFPLTYSLSLASAPFPYEGPQGDTKIPFFDHHDPKTNERCHTTSEGVCYPEKPYYTDSRVFIHVPQHFQPSKPWTLLFFFHGHHTDWSRDFKTSPILAQIAESSANIILIAPQFAKDAADSSPGKFYQEGTFNVFLEDVCQNLEKKIQKSNCTESEILFAGFSGGFKPIAYLLAQKSLSPHLHAVLLLDAFYSEFDKFERWIEKNPEMCWVNVYGESTEKNYQDFFKKLRKKNISFKTIWNSDETCHSPIFIRTETEHTQIPLKTDYLKNFLNVTH